MMGKQLISGLTNRDVMIPVKEPERDWTCVECGHELHQSGRPTTCPECNCTNGDLPFEFYLFVPSESMGMDTGFVTWNRQEASEE